MNRAPGERPSIRSPGGSGGAAFFDDASFQQRVPEPASAGVLGMGLVGLLRRHRRR